MKAIDFNLWMSLALLEIKKSKLISYLISRFQSSSRPCFNTLVPYRHQRYTGCSVRRAPAHRSGIGRSESKSSDFRLDGEGEKFACSASRRWQTDALCSKKSALKT